MRYRVQFYTERHDGTVEWCVCDFGGVALNGLSPKVSIDGSSVFFTTDDRQKAKRLANALNRRSVS